MSLFHRNDIYQVTIDSFFRDEGTSSNFQISPVLPVQSSQFDRVCLSKLQIPRSYYDVLSGYNTFTLRENGLSATITITEGNYNVLTFQSALQTALNLNSPRGWVYSVSYPPATQVNTNKFTYTVSGNAGVQPQFIFTTGLYLQLGFLPNTTNSFVANTITSINQVSMSTLNQLYIKSNLCTTSPNSILYEVLICGNYPSNSYIYEDISKIDVNSREFTNTLSTSWSFQIQDRYGNVVDLEGLDVTFVVMFYKKDITPEVQLEHIRLKEMEKQVKNTY